MILTRYPALEAAVTALYTPVAPFFERHVLYARIDHPLGPLDVYTTHLASSSDSGQETVRGPARAGAGRAFAAVPCRMRSGKSARACQAVQLARLVASTHDVPQPAIITGDFNSPANPPPDDTVLAELKGRGWIDSYSSRATPSATRPPASAAPRAATTSRWSTSRTRCRRRPSASTTRWSCRPERARAASRGSKRPAIQMATGLRRGSSPTCRTCRAGRGRCAGRRTTRAPSSTSSARRSQRQIAARDGSRSSSPRATGLHGDHVAQLLRGERLAPHERGDARVHQPKKASRRARRPRGRPTTRRATRPPERVSPRPPAPGAPSSGTPLEDLLHGAEEIRRRLVVVRREPGIAAAAPDATRRARGC